MNIRHLISGVLAGLLIGVAMLLAALASSSARRPEAATEATPVPRIELEIVGTHSDGLVLAWTDASGRLVGYELFYDVTGEALTSFGPGVNAGTVSDLACGVTHRFWLISTDGRDSNTIVGMTGPCE